MNLNFTLEQEENFMSALGYSFEVMELQWIDDYRGHEFTVEEKVFIAWKGQEKPDDSTISSKHTFNLFMNEYSFRKQFEKEFAKNLIENLTEIIKQKQIIRKL